MVKGQSWVVFQNLDGLSRAGSNSRPHRKGTPMQMRRGHGEQLGIWLLALTMVGWGFLPLLAVAQTSSRANSPARVPAYSGCQVYESLVGWFRR